MNDKGIAKIFSMILKIISYLCLVILVFIAIFLVYFIVSNQVARSTGKRPQVSIFTIVSPSMVPTIMVYDVIVDLRVEDEESLKVGDIITFYSDKIDTGGYTVTHRINDIYVEDGKKYYVTKGDNNHAEDEGSITFENIVGRCLVILPVIGRLQIFITSKAGWALIILLPAIGIILIDIKKIVKVFRIKEQIEEIPQIREVELFREREEDKKLRAVIEEANRMNKGRKNEK